MILKNATVFEYDPQWMKSMTVTGSNWFWELADILQAVASLSGARVLVNKVGHAGESYTLVFVNWTSDSHRDLAAWMTVNPGRRLELMGHFDLDAIMSEINSIGEGAANDDGHTQGDGRGAGPAAR